MLYYYEDCTYEQLARTLGRVGGDDQRAAHQARAMLRERLGAERESIK